MKSHFTTLTFILLSLFISCQAPAPTTGEVGHEALISKIENNLLPKLSIEGMEKSSSTIHEQMEAYNVPGISIAFFDEGKIQWTKCYGYLSKGGWKKVDENTLFQAASISKPVAAAGALGLMEEGKLDLDKNVNEYLKSWQLPENEFNEEKKITFRHLITHTGGLTVHGFRGYAAEEEVPTTVQVLNGEEPANSDPILNDTFPEAMWRYSGGGYTVGQLLMEDITGEAFHEILKSRVLSKVGMSNSTYEQPLPEALRENVAIGHRGSGEKVEGNWHTYPEQAAAGLWTTPSDLARFAIAVQNAFNGSTEEFISPETAKAMLTKHQGDWGLGFGLNGEADSLRFGHGGANEGYRCNLVAFAKLGQGVAIMTNGDAGGSVYSAILRTISDEYGWNVFHQTKKKVMDLSTEDKKKLEGTYSSVENPEYVFKLAMGDEDLVVTQMWDEVSYPILPEEALKFFDIDEGIPFEFELGEDGTASKVLIDDFFEMVKEK